MEGRLRPEYDGRTAASTVPPAPRAARVEGLEDRRLMSVTASATHPVGAPKPVEHFSTHQPPGMIDVRHPAVDSEVIEFHTSVVRGGGVFIGIQSSTTIAIENSAPAGPETGVHLPSLYPVAPVDSTSAAPIAGRGADGRVIMVRPVKHHHHRPPKVKPSIDPDGPGTVEAAGPAVTPLAQSPAGARTAPASVPRNARPEPLVVTVRTTPPPGTLAVIATAGGAIEPTRLALPTASVPNGAIAIATGGSPTAVAVPGVAPIDMPLAPVIEDAATSYNFVRFDPAALLNDTAARFISESASLGFGELAMTSRSRAWVITGAVIAIDALFVGYWLGRRREQRGAERPWGDNVELFPTFEA